LIDSLKTETGRQWRQHQKKATAIATATMTATARIRGTSQGQAQPQRFVHPPTVEPKKHQYYKELDTESTCSSSTGSTKFCGAGVLKVFKKTTCASASAVARNPDGQVVKKTGSAANDTSALSSSSALSSLSTPVSVDAFIDEYTRLDKNKKGMLRAGQEDSQSKKTQKKKFRSQHQGGARPGKFLECLLFLDANESAENDQVREKHHLGPPQKGSKGNETAASAPSVVTLSFPSSSNKDKAPVKVLSTPQGSAAQMDEEMKKTVTLLPSFDTPEMEDSFFAFDQMETDSVSKTSVSQLGGGSGGGTANVTVASTSITVDTMKPPRLPTPRPVSTTATTRTATLPPRSPSPSASRSVNPSLALTPRTSVPSPKPFHQTPGTVTTAALSSVNSSVYSYVSSCSTSNDDADDQDEIIQIDPSVIKSRIEEMKKMQQQDTNNHGSNNGSLPLKGQPVLVNDHSTRSDRAVNAAMTKILKAMAVKVSGEDDDDGTCATEDNNSGEFDGRLSTLLDITTRRGARSVIMENADFECCLSGESCPKEAEVAKSSFNNQEQEEDNNNERNQAEDVDSLDGIDKQQVITTLQEEKEKYKLETLELREEVEQIKSQLAELRQQISISNKVGSQAISISLDSTSESSDDYDDDDDDDSESENESGLSLPYGIQPRSIVF
jgi:hypothetical protein